MRIKNHIKAKNNSLRGIGKLGWTESSATISTQRRLSASFINEDTPVRQKKKRKDKKKCPLCKRNVKIIKGRFMRHTYSWFTRMLKYGQFFECKNSGKEI